MLPLLLLAATAAQTNTADTHLEKNPLYRSLITEGVMVGENLKAKFPAPSMPDGLDAAKQKEVIQRVLQGDYQYENFTRKSVVSPQLLKIGDVKPSDPNAPARSVDVWFIVYGNVDWLEDEKFRSQLLNAGRGEGSGKSLTKDDLAKRKITLSDPEHESYGTLEFDFLEKVHLKATGRAHWSKTGDSLVAAGEVDSRFLNDPEFPNEWQSIIVEGGQKKLGPTHPWAGAAFYIKITKLQEPAGALFCEQHVIFAEPQGWFDGANLLRSKLPLGVQSNVRGMRREWARYGDK